MATTAAAPAYAAPQASEHTGLWSWLTTVDHKRIGVMYLYTSLFFFMFGGLEAVVIRTQLMGPNGQVVNAELYNQLMTMHGTTMVFLAIMPLSAAFFNFLIPLQIGARDVAFPRLNAFSYWVYLLGGTVHHAADLLRGGAERRLVRLRAADAPRRISPGINIDFWVLGLQILGICVTRGGIQLHHHDHQHARARHEHDAHADLHVDVVRGAVPDRAGLPGDHDRAGVPAVRPLLRHELLHHCGRRRPAALAAPVLGLRPPRGLHPDPAGVRAGVARSCRRSPASRCSATR